MPVAYKWATVAIAGRRAPPAADIVTPATTPEMYTDRTIFKRPYLSEYYELEAQIEVCLSPSSMLPVIRTVWKNFN